MLAEINFFLLVQFHIIDKFKSFFGVNGNKSEESIKEVPLPDVSKIRLHHNFNFSKYK